MSEGTIDAASERALDSINALAGAAIRRRAGACEFAERLASVLWLGGADFDRFGPFVQAIATMLEPLNLHDELRGNTDVLGIFYEAFLRYGYDNNALGIVFTPRHITGFCVDLTGVGPEDVIIDPAVGSGGFLVAALDRARGARVSGSETNSTTWALASLNLLFRGAKPGAIEHTSCFSETQRAAVRGKFTRAYLNPPFSQEREGETAFIDAALEALAPGGLLAAVVYAGVFADDDHSGWRRAFFRAHTLLGVISLPEDVFYPTAAPASIVVACAHVPQENRPVFMGRIWNDGFEKLKGRRVARAGEQLAEARAAFAAFMSDERFANPLCGIIEGAQLGDGREWSPQHWLAQPAASAEEIDAARAAAVGSIFQSIAHFPALAQQALEGFAQDWQRTLPALSYGREDALCKFFEISNGRSGGEKNYREGDVPYISSGDATNSIISLIDAPVDELFTQGGITVTAFGQAALQPWPFAARGNGGSAVRVLLPRYAMSVRELIWFAAQINRQRWRFFYARMAIKSRLGASDFRVRSPQRPLPDSGAGLAERLRRFADDLTRAATL